MVLEQVGDNLTEDGAMTRHPVGEVIVHMGKVIATGNGGGSQRRAMCVYDGLANALSAYNGVQGTVRWERFALHRQSYCKR